MPNGRLSKCVLAGRKTADLYQNTSGDAASVTLYANAISTDTNSEISVVVGIASTTLSQLTTMVTSSAGTFCSMTAPHYYSGGTDAHSVGTASTYVGFSVPPTEEFNQPSRVCTPGVAGAGVLQRAEMPVYVDSYGCRINQLPDSTIQQTQSWICMCSSTCINKFYGGNEIQNPSIWMREYPAFYTSCCGGDWWWGGKMVGVFYNNCCDCCWDGKGGNRCNGNPGTWHAINAANVGMGNSSNARQNALQTMINWCCCCGYIGDASVNSGMVPVIRFSGCNSSNGCKCRWGTHCNYMWCRVCACHCCSGGGFKMWNWYALDREFQCCCSDFTNNDYSCFRHKGVQQMNTLGGGCFSGGVEEGKVRTPLWYTFMWCCGSDCGCVLNGAMSHYYGHNQVECGCLCWQQKQDLQIAGCCRRARVFWDWMRGCYCHTCCSTHMQAPNQTKQQKMSPYGFAYGMTNCSMTIWAGHNTTEGILCHRYYMTYPDNCYFKCCEPDHGTECYWYQQHILNIAAPESGSTYCYEFPIKYVAWNCFKTNQCATMGCTYMLLRSQVAAQCGVFSFDANDLRMSQGPFCGCTGNSNFCCGTICKVRQYTPEYAEAGGPTGNGGKLTKVADFPTEMAHSNYSNNNDRTMCTTCLFRADFCTWTMSLFNYDCARWDGFQTNDLITWSKITDPYNVKISNVLTTSVSSDYACIVDDCNCYFANIDCTGIIDYKLSINQYERTGIVLSDGDRIMVNNDADVCLNFQVWGYEG